MAFYAQTITYAHTGTMVTVRCAVASLINHCIMNIRWGMRMPNRAHHRIREGYTPCDCKTCPLIHVYYKAWCDKCARNHMTYQDYLEYAKKQPISQHLAPLIARPKLSRGDSHRYRFKQETMANHWRKPSVIVDNVVKNRLGTFTATQTSWCKGCQAMTVTKLNSRRRCAVCRRYKAVVRLDHEQDASKHGPVHVTSPARHIRDEEEQSVERAFMMNPERFCKICRTIHPKDVPCR